MSDVEFIDISNQTHRGERGFAFFPWQGRVANPQEVLRTGHLVSIQPGHTRGNHYHPGQQEWLFTFHGAGVLVWEAAGEIRERLVAPDTTLIRIPPGIGHALTNPGPEVLYLLAWRQPTGKGPTEPESLPRIVRP
jgi:oxalate decarboxylase/phosphoglucose isomerase-like protein (cupin superfamily)